MKFLSIIAIFLFNCCGAFCQSDSILFSKEVGGFKFELLQKKHRQILLCQHSGATDTVWIESYSTIPMGKIHDIDMFDSVLVMINSIQASTYWKRILWDGHKKWTVKTNQYLSADSIITEAIFLSANALSLSTKKDSSIYSISKSKWAELQLARIILFKKNQGNNKIEVRQADNLVLVLSYHHSKIDTILRAITAINKVHDVALFDNSFVMVSDNRFTADYYKSVWNGHKWKGVYGTSIWYIKQSAPYETNFAIIDENRISIDENGKKTTVKIDTEGKKITKEKK